MIDTKHIDELVKRLLAAIPPGVQKIGEEIDKNFHTILQAAFAKMDLVTREEFDAQVAVLEKTRKKVEALEKEMKKPKKTSAKKTSKK